MPMEREDILDYLRNFISNNEKDGKDFREENNGDQKLHPAITSVQEFNFNDICVPKFTNEFWTAKQRQASSIHEISYRACFKPQLPRFFINLLIQPGDIVYDPFSGRGTTDKKP